MKYRKFLEEVSNFGAEISARSTAILFRMTITHAHTDLKRQYKMGFMNRRKDPGDKRRYLYRVSSKGKKYLNYLGSGHLLRKVILYKLYETMRPEELSSGWKRDMGERLKRELVGKLAVELCMELFPETWQSIRDLTHFPAKSK
jgi:DNA-binding MarR family transcriptional regulator